MPTTNYNIRDGKYFSRLLQLKKAKGSTYSTINKDFLACTCDVNQFNTRFVPLQFSSSRTIFVSTFFSWSFCFSSSPCFFLFRSPPGRCSSRPRRRRSRASTRTSWTGGRTGPGCGLKRETKRKENVSNTVFCIISDQFDAKLGT